MNYCHSIATTDELAEWYSQKYLSMKGTWETPPEECNRHLDALGVPFNSRMTLLDVGCGGGHFLAEAEKRVRCVGLEISHAAIGYATERVRHASILPYSIESYDCPRPSGGYDFITSIGSLEHVVKLDYALDTIKFLLADQGSWYFFCPNEAWQHADQPNERTMPDEEWIALFKSHGLITTGAKRWNDSTAFVGGKA